MTAERVLVVDDEEFNLDIIVEFLEPDGYELVLARDGREALDRLEEAPDAFDLVVLDRMMPVLDGMSVLRRIRANPRFALLPVVFQTAAAAPDQIREGIENGAYYYLTKPFAAETLRAIIRSALEERCARRNLNDRLANLSRGIGLLDSAEFSLATLEEAQALASMLATMCPEPASAMLGLVELITNGIEHGNLGIGYEEKKALAQANAWRAEIGRRLGQPAYRDKRVRVGVERSAGRIVFSVRDEGPGFDWSKFIDFDPERAFDPNGRGIALAARMAFSRLEYTGTGSTAVAVVEFDREVRDEKSAVAGEACVATACRRSGQ